jgi:hypothetical protein
MRKLEALKLEPGDHVVASEDRHDVSRFEGIVLRIMLAGGVLIKRGPYEARPGAEQWVPYSVGPAPRAAPAYPRSPRAGATSSGRT